jgi:hypothetical protein
MSKAQIASSPFSVYIPIMKYTDDYNAKFEIWAKEKKIHPLPNFDFPFRIESKKFSSYEEFNRWKDDLLLRIADAGGLKWKR